MLWVKVLHIVFVITWFAGLFYLPRLFVYHAQTEDQISLARFKIMERRLYLGIMHPSALLAATTGLILWLVYGIGQGFYWMHGKLLLVLVLIAHHIYLGYLLRDFANDRNQHTPLFYRWINEIPALPALLGIVILVVVKPF